MDYKNMKFNKYILVILGSLSWSLIMVRSGLKYNYGLGFWGPNGHDGIWHIALIRSLARGSFDMPTFAGSKLQNYHIGFDLMLALVHRTTGISVSVLYFQIFPILISIGVGVVTYKFVKKWTASEIAANWALFFTYFGGNAAYLLGKGESAFWSQQAISTLINPPYALSLVILFCGFFILIDYLKKPNFWRMLLIIILFGSLIQIKAYAGFLGLAGIGMAGLYRFIKYKKLELILISILAGIVSLILYLPINKLSSGLLVWKPFWFLETMMQLTDRAGWVRFGEAMVNYKYGHVWIKAVLAYLAAFLIFWYGNFWTRSAGEIGIAKWLKNYRKLDEIKIMLLTILVLGILMPLFFLQKGTPWNTIQFFYYSQVVLGVIASSSFAGILKTYKSKFIKYIMMILLVALTIPTTYLTLKDIYLTKMPPAYLSNNEIEALEFLEKQPIGVVLTYPFSEEASKRAASNPPRPLYLYVSNAYVSAYSDKPVYLEDEVNLDITGYDWKARRVEEIQFYNSLDHQYVYNFLRENKITYVYWIKGQRATLGESQLGISRIFENKSVDIYKVN
jgi:hypothetical protein